MSGRGALERNPPSPDSRVLVFTRTNCWVPAQDPLHDDEPGRNGVGPALAFGRQLAAEDSTMAVGLIPCAKVGSSLRDWQKGNELYSGTLERVRNALIQGGILSGILWHQGETDSDSIKTADYADQLAKFVEALRSDLRDLNLPIIVGEIGRFRASNAVFNGAMANLPSKLRHCALATTDGLTHAGDQIHFDTPSARELGRRYAAAWRKMHAPASEPDSATVWHDVIAWGIEGREFADLPRDRWFDRLPSTARENVGEAIWDLSRDSSGMLVRFNTDATSIAVKYDLTRDELADINLSVIARSGVDLYARDPLGAWRWVSVSQPRGKCVNAKLIEGIQSRNREYALYLPMANGIASLSIGVPPDAVFSGTKPRLMPIVFYGTSITHGHCASRPGMTHVSILGRRLEWPVVNLGFAGKGRMDLALADLLGRIDALAFVVDCLPNMHPAMVEEKTRPFILRLREIRPLTPIVLVEDRRLANSWICPDRARLHDENHAALRTAFRSLKDDGVTELYYITGDGLLGSDGDATVDSSHPTDLGFERQANRLEPLLRRILKDQRSDSEARQGN